MKMNTQKREFETDIDTTQVRGFEIKQNAHMLRMLSDGIYSDKPLAVVRELSCNAWDAHIVADNEDTPFHIHLPNDMEPYFSLRDFGTGLSEDDIYGLYCTYGGTNKDQSNEVTGGFGLGSKSPFAYTDQFTVTSFYGGRKMMFNAFIAENAEFQIIKVLDEATDEPVGLEVHMPVEARDFSAFADRTRKVLKRFPVMPLVDGVSEFKIDEVKYLIETPTYKIRDVRRGYYGISGKSYALQGLVAYPIDASSMQSELTHLQRVLLDSAMDIHFDMGEIAMTVSRENINYDKITEANIIKKLNQIADQLPLLAQKEMDEAKTMWEAKIAWNKWGKESDLHMRIKEHIGERLTYKGQIINKGHVEFNFSTLVTKVREGLDDIQEDNPYADVLYFSRAAFDLKRVSSERKYRGRIVAVPDTIFIYDDTDTKMYNQKMDYHFRGEKKNVYFIKAEKKHLKKIKKQLGNPPIQKWSDYEEVPKGHFQTIRGSYEVKKLLKYRGPYTEYWEDTNHQVSDGGLYVMTYSREPKLDNLRSNLHNVIDLCTKLGITDETVFGIQSSFKNIPEQNEGWVHLPDVFKEGVDKLLANINVNRIMTDYIAYSNAMSSSYLDSILKHLADSQDDLLRSSRGEMAQLVKACKVMEPTEQAKNLYKAIKVLGYEYRTLKPTFDLPNLLEKCKTKYPLLETLRHSGQHNHKIHYINVCDASPSIKI